MQNADGVILQYISKIQYIAKWRKIIVIVPLSPPKTKKSITDVVLFLFCVARKTSGDRYFCRFFYCKGGLCKFISIDHPCNKSGLSRPMFSLFTSDSHLIYGGCGAIYIKYQRCPATAVAVRIRFWQGPRGERKGKALSGAVADCAVANPTKRSRRAQGKGLAVRSG